MATRTNRRQRYQKGHVFEKCGAFYVRYYVEGRQRAERLVEKDDRHYSSKCKAVRAAQADLMRRVNAARERPGNGRTVADFWERTYLPFITENLRASTVDGYTEIWESRLQDHFADRTLAEYRTADGSQFLTGLAKRYGRRTLAHVRSLASGIFTHAVNLGLLDSNPWHDVKVLGKVRAPGPTPHYTLEEAENIITALVDRVDCQLVVAFAFFVGLRPSEIAGLRWEDLDPGFVHVRRAFVRGRVGELKTPESQATLPLLPQVEVPLELWRRKSGGPREGWLFQNNKGEPADLRELARRVIRPALEAKKIRWKGLYAGRRGAATALVGLTGNLVAAQELLRHKSATTTAMFYQKRTQDGLASGLRLLGEAAAKGNGG